MKISDFGWTQESLMLQCKVPHRNVKTGEFTES